MSSERVTGDITAAAKGGSLNLVGSAVGAAMSMLMLVVVTRGFGAQAAGAFFESIALFMIVVICSTLGADTGMVRFTARALALDGRTGLSRLMIVALVPVVAVATLVAIIGLSSATTLGRVLGGSGEGQTVTQMVRVLALFVPIGAVGLVVLGATRGYGTMVPTVTADRIVRPAVQLGAALACVVASAGAMWLAGGWGAGVALSLLVGAASLRALWGRRDASVEAHLRTPWIESVRSFWTFSLPRAFASAFRVGVLWLDVVLVGALISPEAAAVYTVATRLIQAGFIAVEAIGQAVEPIFSRLLAREETSRAQTVYQVSTGWLVAATWPLFLTVWIFGSTLLRLFGSGFDDAASAVAILAASALVGSGLGTVDVLLVMSGKTMWSLVNSMIAFIVNVGLNVWLIPDMGLDGAAIAWAVSRVLANALPLLELRSIYGFNPVGRAWRTAAAAALLVFGVAGLVVRSAIGDGLSTLLAFAVIASASYAAILWRWRAALDLEQFVELIGNRLRARRPPYP